MQNWKKIVAACFLGLSSLTAQAISPEELQALEFMKNSFSQVDINRISYISQKMAMDDEAATKFWPRYQAYLNKQIALRDHQLATLTRFATHFNKETLDAKSASNLLNESMKQERQRLTNRQQLVKEMAGTLNPQQQLRLYQLELLLDAQVRSNILTQIPLAESAN